ncbi:sigma-70 family RNA polymerase sigma factor [Jiangella aurantiaca]|uniref:Sigma-70 family RNA polymerase sigma factor n=1 Tax=Jiangella aurantiaca TaxID=2530373 RepID=A0A4R5AP01_9ACTN|nr:sigma-70 family RNA polymerase sigma factor [Jiangella aurantiaca]TDD72022.1 sigma-70 family RNA polymerase sigma factor [Jiangella aurantiaca]
MVLTASDTAALQQLARDELPGLYALARRLAGRNDAEDVVQEALLRACQAFGSLRDHQAGARWLRVILANVWRDRVRKDLRAPRELPVDDVERFSLYRTLVEEDPFPYSDSLHLDFLSAFTDDDVDTVLDRLPPRYRAPLVLRYVEGFATAQIARMLELPLGTVLSQLHRGRRLFEREMWNYAAECGLLPDQGGARAGEREGGGPRWSA